MKLKRLAFNIAILIVPVAIEVWLRNEKKKRVK